MLTAGAQQEIDSFTLDYSLAYSFAAQDTPDDSEISYENETLSYRYSGASSDTPSVSVAMGDQNDLSGYEFNKVKDQDQTVEEKAWILKTNLKKDLDSRLFDYFKSGVYMSLRNKTNDIEAFADGNNPSDFDTLTGNTGGGRKAYSDFPLLAKNLVERFRSNIAGFEQERDLIDSEAEDYETDENVYAAYLMCNMDFGSITVLPGVRYEYTDLKATGNIVDEESEAVLAKETRKHNYDNILPGVNVRASLMENLILNAAWTNSLSRPNWDQTRYARFIDEDGNVEVGNPDLKPFEAMNWDATVSYYGANLGMASVGAFYKDIDNLIYSRTSFQGDYDLTTWQNGDGGHIVGLELATQLDFSTISPILDGFSFLANITFSDSEADVLPLDEIESRTVDFIGNSDTVGNFAVAFEKYGFFAQLSGTYRSAYLDELGEAPSEDRYIDDHFQVDLSAAYTIIEHYTLFADVINLTNEPLKAYWGESGRLSQFEEYGWSARAGVKVNF